jgi:phytoene dehydrogenase-like protein
MAGGEELSAPIVVSAANPRTTFLELVGARHLDTGFLRRIGNMRMRGNAAKLHLALDGPPNFPGLEARHLAGRLVIAPSVDAVESAFNPAKYGEPSEEPVMEITIPSLADPSLAPAGRHVLSAIVQYAPYAIKGGWTARREAFLARVLARLEAHAPGIERSIVASELLTPKDLESRYGLVGGDWHHGELGVDQFYMLRPVAGAQRHETPLPGLWLAGAGCHPGGGVSGAAGFNAAGRILKVEGRR